MKEYKGYKGSVDYCHSSKCYHGKIENTKDLVTYESNTLNGIEKEFQKAVDNYIETMKEVKYSIIEEKIHLG